MAIAELKVENGKLKSDLQNMMDKQTKLDLVNAELIKFKEAESDNYDHTKGDIDFPPYKPDGISQIEERWKASSLLEISSGEQLLLEISSEEKSIYSKFSKRDKEKTQEFLYRSIELKYFELLQEILQIGVDIDIKKEDEPTPLWLVIEENCSLDMISLLMTKSLIGTRYKQNLTPIHRAAMKGDHKLMLKMINTIRDETRPLPDIVQTSEEQQIDEEQQIEQIKSQREKSGQVESDQDDSGQDESSWEIINKKNKKGWTALHYAANNGHSHVLQVLLMEKECDIAMTTKLGRTAFHLAARKGHLLCLKLLFAAAECSQSLNSHLTVDKIGWNIACHASAQDNCDVMEWLLNHMSNCGADITCRDKRGYTLLLIACEYQKTVMFKFLLDKSSEAIQLTKDEKSPLHIAAHHDSTEMVMLLQDLIPVNLQDQYGETALHVAYKWGSTRVQQLLREYGADVIITNSKGEKPADVTFKRFKVPKEIEKRGEAAIAKFVADLKKGKVKMPRCKLMILGEAGVGKTSLLSLLTGEPFDPDPNETEGVVTDFVCTSKICSVTWKKKAMEENEYKDVAAKILAQMLPDEEKSMKHQKKRTDIPTHADRELLKHQFESLVKKYTTQRVPVAPPRPKPKVQVCKSSDLSSPIKDPFTVFPNIQVFAGLSEEPICPSTSVPNPPSTATHLESIPTSTAAQEPRKKNMTPLPRQPLHTTSANPDIHIEVMHRAVKLKKSKSSDKQVKLPLKFSSFDFAGQKHYKPMHHCFLTSRAVYVVAFNVRDLLNERRDHCIHELKFWINSIHIYTDDQAKIVLVGTHRGPYPGIHGDDHLEPLTSEEEETIHKIMVDNFNKVCYASRISRFEVDERIVAMVENSIREGGTETNSDGGGKAIRQKLIELGNHYNGDKDDLPTSYLRLEHKIFEERKQNALISRKDVVAWAREYDIDDPTVALTFFHDSGIIVDTSKLPTIFVTKTKLSVLQDTVLLSPQWLADVMKELMQINKNDNRYDPQSVHWLQQKGIVDEKLLSVLWETQLKEKRETFQLILILLQAYGLIVPVGQREPQQYYIPSQLPSTSKRMKKSTADCNQVHISFDHDDGFLPPFILHHLMFRMYSDSNQSMECCFLATQGFIELLHDCQWWICQDSDNDDVIVVWIRTASNVRSILPAMQYLNQSLQTILNELKAVKYTVGPVATCTSCGEQTLLEYISYNDQHSKIANDLKCPNCAYRNPISSATMSKAYVTTFKSFCEEIKKYSEGAQKHLEKKFKKNIGLDGDDLIWDDVLEEWYEKNKQEPWPRVESALESYAGVR